jgi:C4-type Zn-finger protein
MKTRIKCAICGHTFDFSMDRRDTPSVVTAQYDSKYVLETCPSCNGTFKVEVSEI